MLLLAIIFLSVNLGACFLRPYHIDIQQGNILTPKDTSKVKPGMTSQQVQTLLGSPVLTNIFADGRMVYIYTLQLGYKKMHKRYLFVYFRLGRVTHIQTDVLTKPLLRYQVRTNYHHKELPK